MPRSGIRSRLPTALRQELQELYTASEAGALAPALFCPPPADAAQIDAR